MLDNHIPSEIIQEICWFAANDGGSKRSISNNLASLATVSKHWNAAVTPLLYRKPPFASPFNYEKTPWFTISENPHLASMVKEAYVDINAFGFEFDCDGSKCKLAELMHKGLANACNLTHLHIANYDNKFKDFFVKLLSFDFPKLSHLKIDGDVNAFISHVTLPKVEYLDAYIDGSPGKQIFQLIPKLLATQESHTDQKRTESNSSGSGRPAMILKHLGIGRHFSQPELRNLIESVDLTKCKEQLSRFRLESFTLIGAEFVNDSPLVELLESISAHLEHLQLNFVTLSPDFFLRTAPLLTNLKTLRCVLNHDLESTVEYPTFYASILKHLLPSALNLESLVIDYLRQNTHSASTVASSSPEEEQEEEAKRPDTAPVPLPTEYFEKIVAPVACKLHTLVLCTIEIPAQSLCKFSHAPISRLRATLAGDDKTDILSKEDIKLVLQSFQHLTDFGLLNEIDASTMEELHESFPPFLTCIKDY